MSLRILFSVAILASALAACGPSGHDLVEYADLQVDVGTFTDPNGVTSLRVRLSTPGSETTSGPTAFATAPGNCVVLSPEVGVTFDGQPMQVESLGASEHSVLGSDFCDAPTFSAPLPPPTLAGSDPATFVIEDASKTVTVVVPDLFAVRTVSLASDAPVHPGDQLDLVWDDPDDDLSYLDGRTPIARCEDGAVIDLSGNGTRTCLDAAWLQNRQVEVTVPPSTPTGPAALTWNVDAAMPPDGPMAKVSACDGAIRCRAAVPYPPEPLEITISP